MTGGRFITFEGGEGAGKSTQVRLLADFLKKEGKGVTVTREPGGTPGAERIRRLLVDADGDGWEPMAEALLHFAARRVHLAEVVWPALARDEWVISDRFVDSTRAYQGYGQGLSLEIIERLYRVVAGDFDPDLTIVLDLPVETGLARATRHGRDRYEGLGDDFHERVRQGFLSIAKREPDRCVVIDAAKPAGDVTAAIRAAVRDRLLSAE